jgi:hypothetical protein
MLPGKEEESEFEEEEEEEDESQVAPGSHICVEPEYVSRYLMRLA